MSRAMTIFFSFFETSGVLMNSDSLQLDRVYQCLGGLIADSRNEMFPPAFRSGVSFAVDQLREALYGVQDCEV